MTGFEKVKNVPHDKMKQPKDIRTTECTMNENEAGLAWGSRLPRQVRWYRQLMLEIGKFVSVEWTSHTKEHAGVTAADETNSSDPNQQHQGPEWQQEYAGGVDVLYYNRGLCTTAD